MRSRALGAFIERILSNELSGTNESGKLSSESHTPVLRRANARTIGGVVLIKRY